MAEKRRSLFEIALDVSKAGMDAEACRDILEGAAHEALLETWGNELEGYFDEALSFLREQLKPCPDAFSDVDLRRIIGMESAWIAETRVRDKDRPFNLAAERDKFLNEARFGLDPLTDPDSPSKRLGELETYLRTWADFPAFGFGIPDLDNATGGILPGEICVLTGAPGTMKTSLALSAVDDYVSRTEKGLVCYCSVDMAPRDITMRLLERENQVPEMSLKQMKADKDAGLPQMLSVVRNRYDGRLAINGHKTGRRMTINKLLFYCLKRQPQLVVIDYFTCLKEKGQSDLEFVEDAMPRILDYAHQYETSFLILSQMSKASRSEQAGGRMGGHSRGGGLVSELAHTEIELFQQQQDGDKPLVIAAITKARRGIAGQYFSLDYIGSIKKFTGRAQRMTKQAKRQTLFERDEKFLSLAS